MPAVHGHQPRIGPPPPPTALAGSSGISLENPPQCRNYPAGRKARRLPAPDRPPSDLASGSTTAELADGTSLIALRGRRLGFFQHPIRLSSRHSSCYGSHAETWSGEARAPYVP